MRVRFTVAARRDLGQIYAHVSKDSSDGASRLVAGLIERSLRLADNPLEGRETDEPNARVIVVPRLRCFIFYTVTANEIYITHIRHTSRQRPSGWS